MAAYLDDPGFQGASDPDRHAYLSSVDKDYAGAKPAEQQAYLAHLRGPGNTGPSAPVKPSEPQSIREKVTKGVTDVAGAGLAFPGNLAMRVAPKPMAWLMNAPTQGIDSPEAMAGGERAANTAGTDVARDWIVPQSKVGQATAAVVPPALRVAGKLATSAPSVIRALAKPVTGAVTGAAAGAGVNAAGGDSATEGAQAGAVAGGAMGALPGVLGKMAQVMPGGKQAISDLDAQRYLNAIRTTAPDVYARIARSAPPGGRPSQVLQLLVQQGDLKRGLDSAMTSATGDITRRIRNQRLDVPDLSSYVDPATHLPVSVPRTFEDMWRLLVEDTHGGYAGAQANPLTRNIRGLDERELRQRAVAAITAELIRHDPSGEAAMAWERARGNYASGKNWQDLLGPGAFKQGQLNTPTVQSRFQKGDARIIGQTGDSYDTIQRTLFRGAPSDVRDELVPGGGHLLDTLRMILQRKGGSAAVLGAPVTTLAPNLASKYVGQTPSITSPVLNAIINAQSAKHAGDLN